MKFMLGTGCFFVFNLIAIHVHAQNFIINGDAQQIGSDCFRLSEQEPWQKGSVWSAEPISLEEPFRIDFYMRFSNNPAGADGITFAFQSEGPEALGNDGEGMGYEGITPSFAVEFDIFTNNNLADPNFDHIAVHRNGNVLHNGIDHLFGPIQAWPFPSIKNGTSYEVQITWNPVTKQFRVFYQCNQRVFMTYDIVANAFNGNPNVYWGFTGATGGQACQMDICLYHVFQNEPITFQTCAGQPIAIGANGGAYANYKWAPAQFLNDFLSPEPIATVEQTTVFTALISDICEQDYASQVTVEVIDDFHVDLGPDLLACLGDTVSLILPEGPSYTWNTGSTADTLRVTETGLYWVDASLFGCTGTDTLEVQFSEGFSEYGWVLGPATCGAADGRIDVQVVLNAVRPLTYFIDGIASADSLIEGLGAGTYTIEVVDAAGCSFNSEFTIPEVNPSLAAFSASPTEGTAPLEVVLSNLSQNVDEGFYLVGSEIYPIETELIVFEQVGNEDIMLITWQNSPHCADTASVAIQVYTEVSIDIPNIVTPNGDGRNDNWTLALLGIDIIQARVYNRWGNELLNTPEISTKNAERVSLWFPDDHPDGVYQYILRYTDSNGQRHIKEGQITLTR